MARGPSICPPGEGEHWLIARRSYGGNRFYAARPRLVQPIHLGPSNSDRISSRSNSAWPSSGSCLKTSRTSLQRRFNCPPSAQLTLPSRPLWSRGLGSAK